MKVSIKTLVLLVAVVLFSAAGFAATSAVNATQVQPTLHVQVNVQTALSLTLSTGLAGTSCTISPGATQDYDINFGNVNALGIPNGANCTAPLGANATGAVWSTEYRLTPTFSGFANSTANIVLNTTTAFANSNLTLVESGTNTFAALQPATVPATGTTHSFTTTNNGTPLSRYIGVNVAPGNGAGTAGSDNAVVTFTMTVP
jgi:type 1 fimbria pilin